MTTTKHDKLPTGKSGKSAPPPVPQSRGERVRALRGKYAFIPGSSDDFAKEKTREIEREDRLNARRA